MLRRLLLCLAFVFAHAATAADWTTPAEANRFSRTPSYAETMAYLDRLVVAAPEQLRLVDIGTSPEGRALRMVIAASNGEFTPNAARASGKEIVFVQAGIHSGEIEGKDAGLMLLRDLTVAKKRAKLLDRVVLLYLPIFNVDGHEDVSPFHRVNQNGPEETGWRGSAQNINLNRDYVKADAPEMQAWLGFWNAWLPDLLIDVHTTDGADYQYDLTWYTEDWANVHPAVKAWQNAALKGHAFPRTEKRGHRMAPYLELVDHRDITKGIANFGSGPRFSTGYAAVQNRAGLLVETHMLKSYATRVKATYDVLVEILTEFNAHPGALRKAVTQADADAAKLAADPESTIALGLAQSGQSVPFMLKGYAFTQTPSPISGDVWTQYDPTKKKTHAVPFFRDLVATDTVHPPAAYLIPAAWQDAIRKLEQHGIRVERLKQPTKVAGAAYRITDPVWADKPFEGRLMLKDFQLSTESHEATYPAGSAIVPLNQRTANLIVQLLEPKAPDSLLRWGYFNIIFEQREYADARVAEHIARDLLREHPELQAEFDEKLKDPEFAKNPATRLAFFFDRSVWRDERVGRYPVVKLDAKRRE